VVVVIVVVAIIISSSRSSSSGSMGLGAYYFGSRKQKIHLYLQSTEYYK
jgi:preprotein translocase subunit SecG